MQLADCTVVAENLLVPSEQLKEWPWVVQMVVPDLLELAGFRPLDHETCFRVLVPFRVLFHGSVADRVLA
jgi:hypothetical protein